MKKEITSIMETDFMKTELHENLIVVNLKGNVFESIISVEEGFTQLEWLRVVEKDDRIKGILYLGERHSFSREAYIKFLSNITGEDLSNVKHKSIKKFVDQAARSKQLNMVNNYISGFMKFPKIIFALVDGCIVTPFIGLSLAADIRIGTPSTQFSFIHKNFGLHPSGALPFLLNQSVGHSKTQEILYKAEDLNVTELKELKLIQYIVEGNFKEESIKLAIHILDQEYSTIKTTKYLINTPLQELFEEYTQNEKKIILS